MAHNENNVQGALLEVRNLRTSFFTHNGEVRAVNDVSFHVDRQEVVAIVGESGCGKSVTQMSVMQLVQTPPGKILGGEVLFEGRDLLKLNAKQMRSVRGSDIAMIFQEPMTSLNPVYTVGSQLTEVIRTHMDADQKTAWRLGVEALESVGIPDPEQRMKNYPFEMSGGMRQRVMIAMAIACRPKVLIADEPTTALDVTIQAQVLELMKELVADLDMAIIFITHDLGVIAEMASDVLVMYAGRVVEQGTVEDIFESPRHVYTRGLMRSRPSLAEKNTRLACIPGMVPTLANLPKVGCAFAPRCEHASEQCVNRTPELTAFGGGHYARCWYAQSGEEGR